MRKTAYLFYFLLFLLTAAGCNKNSEPLPDTQDNTAVTIDNYNRITVGMSYTQVVAILNKETSSSGTTYSWSADNTNSIVIYLVITNNVVQSKSQTGLASPSGGTSGSGGTTAGGCPSSYNGHTVYTGPRGGCYYINSKGNKTYI
jgi:hypothetical protein